MGVVPAWLPLAAPEPRMLTEGQLINMITTWCPCKTAWACDSTSKAFVKHVDHTIVMREILVDYFKVIGGS